MSDPSFRFVCVAAALQGAPGEWAREMLRDGEVALHAGDGGLEAIGAVAHTLALPAVLVVRGEDSSQAQEQTVIDYAGELPLVWVEPAFSEHARRWAHDRGAMTLLVEADAALAADERARIGRFVASLGRQSE
ncbi:MAG: hypothetical protein ACYC0H_22355 [Solirubrobacteraceae bacterium]